MQCGNQRHFSFCSHPLLDDLHHNQTNFTTRDPRNHNSDEGNGYIDGSEGDDDDLSLSTSNPFLTMQPLHGIAIAPCGASDELKQAVNDVIEKTGIPIVTLDSDLSGTKRSAYISSDNVLMGQTMAKVLKQLRSEGGRFAFLTSPWGSKPNVDERVSGFRNEMYQDYGSTDSDAQWYEINASPLDLVGQHTFRLQIVVETQQPDAIITTYLTPMRGANWTDFVNHNRHRSIIYIGTDAVDFQLDYLHTGHVDGLVGQLPYDMGRVSAEVLHELTQHRKMTHNPSAELEEWYYPTNLVSYTLIPLELPELNVDHNLLGPLVYVGYICFAIVLLFSIICMGWTLYHRNDLVVKSSQPFFLVMIVTGVVILSSTIIPLSLDDTLPHGEGGSSTETPPLMDDVNVVSEISKPNADLEYSRQGDSNDP